MSEEKRMPCNGHCRQGRDACPTPQACELPQEDEPTVSTRALGAILAVSIVTVIIALVV